MKPRDPSEVINRILAATPADEYELRAHLEKVREDSWFFPPEGQVVIWSSLRAVLERRFPSEHPPAEAWAMTVSRIVRGLE
jgi:hypothetical protein